MIQENLRFTFAAQTEFACHSLTTRLHANEFNPLLFENALKRRIHHSRSCPGSPSHRYNTAWPSRVPFSGEFIEDFICCRIVGLSDIAVRGRYRREQDDELQGIRGKDLAQDEGAV